MRRKKFLQEFIGALGAVKILWREETIDEISGTVIYDLNDPEERQDFVWHASEDEVPHQNVLDLAKLLRKQELLNIDQIRVTRSELKDRYNKMYERITSDQEFEKILDKLESIEVPMVDEGRETDAYFIHE